ncbi:MAG: type IV pilus twitching motility protein PilT [Lachnospiraceae bacterium]|nr:type IV pilus twitching motility protein PilT [Lachnospiraceae bacterium]
MKFIDEVLYKVTEMEGVSDVHITVGVPIVLRQHGELVYFDDKKLLPDDTKEIVKSLMSDIQFKEYEEKGELDFSYSVPGSQRFRVNAYHQRNTCCVALRCISATVPPMETLGLPPIVSELANKKSGLVLVTGPTGSGKSTTLASIVDKINNTKKKHIITLEDPIEYLFRHNLSIVNQREIGSDTRSFANALRACLRQDPDVILVGEMRDFETISIALTAAETGHLVLSTLHTIGAASTIDRIVDIFPPNQQAQIKVQLAATLQAVISQQLLKRCDKPGRVVATEVLVVNNAIRNMIREGKNHLINNSIKTGAMNGMMLMDDSLMKLYKNGMITQQQLLEFCVDKSNIAIF